MPSYQANVYPKSATSWAEADDAIDLEMISVVEGYLDLRDLISVVFLLYEDAGTALKSLIILERTKVCDSLIQQWAVQARFRSTWKREFLEALYVCQQYGVIRRLGIRIPNMKEKYSKNDFIVDYINPVKTILYKLCENMDSALLQSFKHSLAPHDIDVVEFKVCELIILKLMSVNFIQVHKKTEDCRFSKLIDIVVTFPMLKHYSDQLKNFEHQNHVHENFKDTYTAEDFDEEFQMIEREFAKADLFEKLAPDSQAQAADKDLYFPVKNTNKVGVCFIINQEKFNYSNIVYLPERTGSDVDKKRLCNTFYSLKFRVFHVDNLNHDMFVQNVKEIIQKYVTKEDSMFVLCILSHGVMGHVYGVDCKKVEVDYLQNILSIELHKANLDIPRVLIIQACQVKEEGQLVGPMNLSSIALQAECLVAWATAPGLKAYRMVKRNGQGSGSIFIKLLCENIAKFSDHKALVDILTRVHYDMKLSKVNQVSKTESTLTRSLYLQKPKY